MTNIERNFVSGDSGAVCSPLQSRSRRQIEVERRRLRSHDHVIAVYDWQATHGAVPRPYRLRINVWCCRLAHYRVDVDILLGAAFVLGR